MDILAIRTLLLLTFSPLSIAIVQISDSAIDLESLTNGTQEDLKKFEYSHAYQTQEQVLNCSDYSTRNDFLILHNGSLYLTESNTFHDRSRYYVQNGTAFLCMEDESDSGTNSGNGFSDEFLVCGHFLIEPGEYKVLENGDVYIEVYSKTYGPRDYYLKEGVGVYICIPSFENKTNGTFFDHYNKFSDAFTYVTATGIVISVISLMSHLSVFCVIPSVRNLPGCCLASLSLSLLMAYICFLIVAMVNTGSSCSDFGLCIYYFFLTSFFWMNAIAFDVWRSFRVVIKELRISSHKVPWRRFLAYSLYSWSIPGILALLVRVLDSSDILSEDWRPSFGKQLCWFGKRKALLTFFAMPLIIVMVLNAAFFLDVSYVISRATLKTSRSHEATLKKRFFMFMKLALIMGLTWIVGLVAGYADYEFLWYIFVILNTLQGLFILVVFSCSSKVRGLCCRKYRNSNLKRGSTSVRTISQISATV
ncbi:g-protein coupled receptor Mth2 [Trichonephila clavipes]|uniref:G-protein coupled receptor Mth2 n=1 Tax=Trichonephila clavipes TaxID=2585209 RepID=A0A8X7BBF2_TRICX|nr:g-protein coupled receptor Mth2 [Trichonephila clavipes]